MAFKYCTCGSKTEYTVKVPAFCSACGTPFNKAFVSTPKIETKPSPSITSKIIKKSIDNEVEENEDNINQDEVENLAQELIASLSVSDFFTTETREDKGFKIEDVLDPTKNINVGKRD